jgi:O-antigen biosynthesis protein
VMDRLRERLDRPVELDVVGVTREDADWFHRIPVPRGTANYPAFARWLATVAPGHAVALAPLRDTPFNRAKSDLKWLEYSALELPGVFSNITPYATSVEDGVTGLLVDDDPDRWAAAIGRLLDDPDEASEIAARARARVAAERTLDRRVRERVDVYRSLARTLDRA